jgi:hypothetical protein
LAAAYEVAPDFGEVCAEIVRRMALKQSKENFAAVAEVVTARSAARLPDDDLKENFAAVAEVVTACVIQDSRNMNASRPAIPYLVLSERRWRRWSPPSNPKWTRTSSSMACSTSWQQL